MTVETGDTLGEVCVFCGSYCMSYISRFRFAKAQPFLGASTSPSDRLPCLAGWSPLLSPICVTFSGRVFSRGSVATCRVDGRFRRRVSLGVHHGRFDTRGTMQEREVVGWSLCAPTTQYYLAMETSRQTG